MGIKVLSLWVCMVFKVSIDLYAKLSLNLVLVSLESWGAVDVVSLLMQICAFVLF